MYGKPHPKPCVTAAIVNEKKEILLTLRSDKVLFPHVWCLPGGHLEGGSSWLDTLALEVREEVGLEVVASELVGLYSDPKFHYLTDPGSQSLHAFVGANFLVKKWKGDVKINSESSQFGWFALEAFPPTLLDAERIKAEDALRFIGVPFIR